MKPNKTFLRRYFSALFPAILVMPTVSLIYGMLFIETGKVNPLEQLKVHYRNFELIRGKNRVEADGRYSQRVYELFGKGCGALADLNKDCKISLEEITEALKAMSVTQGDLERAVKAYRNGEYNRIKEK